MKIKQLLESENIEAQYSEETLYKTLSKKCSQFINEFGDYGPIVRLDSDISEFFLIKDTADKRKSHSMIFQNKILHDSFNKLLEEFGHNNRVENVVFGTTVGPTQSSIQGEQYYLFPMDGYSYTYETLSKSDFHVENPIGEELAVLSPIVTQNEELLAIQLADEMKEIDDKNIKNIYDQARDLSEKIDRYVFDPTIIEDYKSLKNNINQYNMTKSENGSLINFYSKIKELIKSIDCVRNYIKNHYYTDTIISELFNEPTEIYFKTQQYILVSTKFEYDYNEIIKNAKQYMS
ncbi:hypothetical protein PBI_SCTP2_262 [Salicola phage SCTP-2]|nr:hypothetical protein PBI_SCTP2_262 [Salicola phage SCTP-2]